MTPKKLREDILGHTAEGELLLVDEHWAGRAINLAVGDHVVVPAGTTVEGATVKLRGRGVMETCTWRRHRGAVV